MENKRFYKVIRAFKHNGEIREFPLTLPCTFNEAYALVPLECCKKYGKG